MLQGGVFLEGYYEVFLGDRPAGKLHIEKNGLYYSLTYRCHVPKDTVYRLFALKGSRRENLGVVVPEEEGCVLCRKVPVKKLMDCTGFILSSRSGEDTGKFVPIYPEEPFSYIVHLEKAFLDVRNGQIGAYWPQKNGAE